MYEGVEVLLNDSTSVPDGSEWVNFMLQPLYSWGKRPQYPLATRVGGTRATVDAVENEKTHAPVRNEP
jgi:hypothetical protein